MPTKITSLKIALLSSLAFVALFSMNSSALAQADNAHVDVTDAWIRPTVAGQMGTGGFMKLTAREDLQLVGVSSPVAKVAEVHEMRASKTDANVMEMRPVKSLVLPKGQMVELKAGSYHLMLMEMKQLLSNGQTVPVTLHFKNAKGVASKLEIKAMVGRSASQAKSDKASESMHKH
jgi:periplasmic copper chaperone A